MYYLDKMLTDRRQLGYIIWTECWQIDDSHVVLSGQIAVRQTTVTLYYLDRMLADRRQLRCIIWTDRMLTDSRQLGYIIWTECWQIDDS